MPERPILPPPNTMIRELPTPDPNLGYYTELVARTSDRFQALSPIRRGTLYATCIGADQRVIDLYPAGLFFLRETVPIGSSTVAGMTQSDYVRWIWSSDPDAEGVANAEVSYLGDAVANPAFTRAFTIRRDVYDAAPTVATGTAYTALIAIKVTAAGTGYTKDDVVNISGSLGATAALVVNAAGAIQHVVITKEGSGYDSAALPTVTVTSTGSGATLVAIVQPKTAVLTSQKKIEFPDSDPQSHHYVRVLRSYEVLPGPYLPFTRYDENLGPIQGRRRAVVNTGQAAAITATSKKTYEARDGSSFVSWEIEEVWSDGTGGAGNPAYPILVKDFYDDERGAVQQTSQIVVATGSEVGSLVNTAGVITRITYEPYADNPALLRKVIETSAQTGPLLSGQDYDSELGIVIPNTDQIVPTGTAVGADATSIKPLNIVQSENRTIDLSALDALLDTYVLAFPSTASFNFPPVLTSIVGLIEEHYGDGEYDEDGSAYWLVDGSGGASASLSIQGSGQASASVIPKMAPNMRQPWDNDRPVMEYMFLLPMPVTPQQVLLKLIRLANYSATVTITIASPGVVTWTAHGLNNGETVILRTTGALPTGLSADTIYYIVSKATNTFQLSLTSGGTAINTSGSQSGVHTAYRGIGNQPKFSPVTHTFFCVGQSLDLTCKASSNWQDGGSFHGDDNSSEEHSESSGTGTSRAVGLSVEAKTTPPCIHGALSMSGDTTKTRTIACDANATASISASVSQSGSVTGRITPTSLSATDNQSSIPTFGLFLSRIDGAPWKYKRARFRCVVGDFADVG